MTQNIWNYNRTWPQRRSMIAALILHERPDVVCLQETRHDFRYEKGRGQGEQLAELTGYHLVTALGQVYVPLLRVDEGLSILSRTRPIRSMSTQLTKFPRQRKDGNQRVCLGVALEIDGIEIDIYDAHFSMSGPARMSNAREVQEFISSESGARPSLLMGDLNTRPESPPIEFLAGPSAEFVDCWTAAHPTDPGFTYSSWHPYHRIDYVLARNLSGRVLAARVVGGEPNQGVYASDHLGVVVDLQP